MAKAKSISRKAPTGTFPWGRYIPSPLKPASGIIMAIKPGGGRYFIDTPVMVHEPLIELQPTARVDSSNSFKVEDVLRMGKQAFFESVSPKISFPIPDLRFTEEENRKMDEILASEIE